MGAWEARPGWSRYRYSVRRSSASFKASVREVMRVPSGDGSRTGMFGLPGDLADHNPNSNVRVRIFPDHDMSSASPRPKTPRTPVGTPPSPPDAAPRRADARRNVAAI